MYKDFVRGNVCARKWERSLIRLEELSKHSEVWLWVKEREKNKNCEQSLRDQWNNIKWYNTCIIGVPEEEEIEEGAEKISEEITPEIFVNLMKTIKPTDPRSTIFSNQGSIKRTTLKQTEIKCLTNSEKETILNVAKEKNDILYIYSNKDKK